MKHIKCFYKAPVCLVWDSYCGGEGELAVVGTSQTSALELGWGQSRWPCFGRDPTSEARVRSMHSSDHRHPGPVPGAPRLGFLHSATRIQPALNVVGRQPESAGHGDLD